MTDSALQALAPGPGRWRCVALTCLLALGWGLTFTGASLAQGSLPPAGLQHSVAQLLERAVSSHPSVQAKVTELGAGRATLEAAQWQAYPSLSLQSERAGNSGNTALPANTSTNLRLQQTLWSGGRITAAVQNAEWKQRAAQYALQDVRTTVGLRTLEAWQGLLVAQGRQLASVRLLAQLEQLNGMMARRITQQISPAIDGQLLRARLAQAQSEQLSAATAAEAARQRLVQWVGPEALALMPSHAASLDLAEPLQPWPADTAQQLQRAIDRSPSLRRYDADTAAVREELRQREAEQWPTVYARIERQFNSHAPLLGKTVENTVYVGLQYSTGAGLSLRAQVAAAQARAHSLEDDRASLLRQLQENYTSEWREYQATLARIGYAQSVQDSNATLFESYTRLFVAGRRSWLELLNALREQNAADQSLTDLQAQQQASHARLRLYLGGFAWQTEAAS
jgi:outer membrane protein, adhesin transport system